MKTWTCFGVLDNVELCGQWFQILTQKITHLKTDTAYDDVTVKEIFLAPPPLWKFYAALRVAFSYTNKAFFTK